MNMKQEWQTYPDSDLVQLCRTGNRSAYGVLVTRYQRPVYHLCWRLLGNPEDARDATQESLVKAWQSLHLFRINDPFGPWVRQITRNHCLDRLRIRSRQGWTVSLTDTESENEEMSVQDLTPGVRDQLMEQDDRKYLFQVIQNLPEIYRIVLTLRYLESLDIDTMSQELDLPKGTVKSHLYRARAILRTKMEKTHDRV